MQEDSQIKEILTRGVERLFPEYETVKKQLITIKPLRIYFGIDPTGKELHIGHAIGLRKLRAFQKLGHKIILLIGDFTAMIGDPTDKSATRTRLTRDQVIENCANYKKIASKILNFDGDNPAELRFNNEWLSKLSFSELIELGAHFTVQNLLDRDMFKKRISDEKPIYLHEFFYPLMQGYDSVVLNVDGEIGGNDQMFNMLAGRDLSKQLNKKEKFVMTFKLLTDTSGKKMGKTTGNMITLTEKPQEMFGKVMSWTDGMIARGFELCTDVPLNEIEKIESEMKNGTINPRDVKMRLAHEIVSYYHNKEEAQKAEKYFMETFSKKQTPTELEIHNTKTDDLIQILVDVRFCSTKSDARRAIEQGGVKINGETINSNSLLKDLNGNEFTLQKGKRHFIKIKIDKK